MTSIPILTQDQITDIVADPHSREVMLDAARRMVGQEWARRERRETMAETRVTIKYEDGTVKYSQGPRGDFESEEGIAMPPVSAKVVNALLESGVIYANLTYSWKAITLSVVESPAI